MEPKFEFVGTTDSRKYNVKTKAKNNRVFHVKKIYPDGRETYCEYTTNRVNVNTICLRCTNKKCKGTLILETSQPTHVARRQVLASGKERNIYDFTESADLSDDTKYGNPHHKHVNTANCRFRDGNNECKATKHHFTAGFLTIYVSVKIRSFSTTNYVILTPKRDSHDLEFLVWS